VTAVATGEPGSSVLYARYLLENDGEARRDLLLFLALRPFQVLPPWQSLNGVGGVTPIEIKSVRGFHVRHWIRDGMSFWAVSDLSDAELTEFGRTLQGGEAVARERLRPSEDCAEPTKFLPSIDGFPLLQAGLPPLSSAAG